MSRYLLAFLLGTVILGGCVSSDLKRIASENAARCKKFVAFIDEGKTTRDQEQEFIRANAMAWKALDEKFND